MFSKATEYALRATIYIAQKSTEENNRLDLRRMSLMKFSVDYFCFCSMSFLV